MTNITNEEKIVLQKLFELNKKILAYIDICNELENNLYKKLNNHKITTYIEYLHINFFNNISNYDLIICDIHELFLIKRIINILDVKETDLIIQDIKSYDNEFKTSYLTVFHSIKEDFQTLFIYFLNEFINDDDNKIYKNRLIKAKYLICFLEPQLENKLINNDFNNNILISQSTTDLLGINNTEYNQLVLSYVKSFMLIYINKLLNIKDYEYIDYNKRVNSLIYQVLIKSIYEMLNFKISNIVYDNNGISINILENIKNQKGSYKLIKLRSERIFL